MSVLIDTSIWSLALRRRRKALSRREAALVDDWARLVADRRAVLIGPIRQEILSGIKRPAQFDMLRQSLAAFVHIGIEPEDYDTAAKFFNTCRAKGAASGPIDMLICAVASRAQSEIFSMDNDFVRFKQLLPIELYEPPT
jgi:hypothetical protein